ncbi:hypothetical protein FOL47_007192 [Perkinsus chesapeaki]|uniref:P-type phospholipid transporter n=1 Tax=Perkinsus chesapeaki TaxID=330153 RepID=A0A7J6LM60_PERCH|nr:hypothetical protein FOL47_007192 [Perkinsus chesapeaki]
MSTTSTPASLEEDAIPPQATKLAEITEASALAAQFVIQHKEQQEEAAKKATAQPSATDLTNGTSSPVVKNGDTSPIGEEAASPSGGDDADDEADEPTTSANPAELVDNELSSFVERVALTDEDHHIHNHILGSILSVARSNLDIEATIETFGSAASGLSEKSSDIDATIICRFSALKKRFGATGDEKSLCSAAVMGLGKAISKFEKEAPGVGLRVVQVIPSAKVPIVVLSWIGPNGNVQIVDVSINNQLPLHNTALLRNYVEMDKRVQILALCVKRWAKLCAVSDAKEGNLSSYSWTLLCIYFLQVRSKGAVLPSLQAMAAKKRQGEQVKHYSCPISGRVFNVDFVDRFEATSGEDGFKAADTTPSELLRDFFVFYDRDYKWGSEVVSIRTGQRHSIDEYVQLPRRDADSNILIEDPLDLSRNLNCVLDYEGRIRLRRAFSLFANKVADATMEELLVQAKTLTRMRTGPTAAAIAAKHAQNAAMGVGGPPGARGHGQATATAGGGGLTAPTLQQHTATMSAAAAAQQQQRLRMRMGQDRQAPMAGNAGEYQNRLPGMVRGGGMPVGGYNMGTGGMGMPVGLGDIRNPNLTLSPVKDGPGASAIAEGIRGVRVQQQQPAGQGRSALRRSRAKTDICEICWGDEHECLCHKSAAERQAHVESFQPASVRSQKASSRNNAEAAPPEDGGGGGGGGGDDGAVRCVTYDREAASVEWKNFIRTSKYTPLTFLPLNLWYQFHLFANIYFLAAAALQCIPSISDSGGQPLLLLPLIFVLAVAAIRDLAEDIQRHKSDTRENGRKVTRILQQPNAHGHHTEEVTWADLGLGDVIKVKRGEGFPADLVMLSSEDESGMAYVETMNLDGETNLKPKMCNVTIMNEINNDKDAAHFTATLKYEKPNTNLYKFDGEMVANGRAYPLTVDQFLLRGSTLQTTAYIYGVVVYCGDQTRIFRNAADTGTGRDKLTKLMATYNQHVITLFILQAFICIVAAAVNAVYTTTTGDWYLDADGTSTVDGGEVALDAVKVVGTLLLQFTYFVPISLLVTLEIVKFFQAKFINEDQHMVSGGTTTPSSPASLTLPSSQASGPLPTVRHWARSWAACAIGTGGADSALLVRKSQQEPEEHRPHHSHDTRVRDRHVGSDFDVELFKKIVRESSGAVRQRFVDFLICLSVCHSVLIKADDEEDDADDKQADQSGHIHSDKLYDASSPDELALVAGARELGMEFAERPTVNSVRVNLKSDFAKELMGLDVEYMDFELMDVIEFDNDRKRMSVLVKEILPTADSSAAERRQRVQDRVAAKPAGQKIRESCPHPRTLLLIKGADSSMLDVATPLSGHEDTELAETLATLAANGLRTLVYGVRDLTDEIQFVNEWQAAYSTARGRIGDDKKKAIYDCMMRMESEVELLGSTGIEDKLQEQVPEVIQELHSAGIKLWVLTGDKIETAINIGYSSNLLTNEVYNQIIDSTCTRQISAALAALNKLIESRINTRAATLEWDHDAEEKLEKEGYIARSQLDIEDIELGDEDDDDDASEDRPHAHEEPEMARFRQVAITVSGDALAVILRHKALRLKFFRLALANCTTVIACRVSPKQKADVVKWSGSYLPANTMLAIGDGANDVGMIVVADVGVGLNGKEGAQAARSADYAIPEFRFLRRLLFLHGREAVRKNSIFVYYTVYKNVAFSLPTFFLGFYSYFSGTNLYDPILKQVYNVLFTVFPILLHGVFDRDLPASVLARCAFLYKFGHRTFGNFVLARWIFGAIWTAIWCLLPPLWILYPESYHSDGYTGPSDHQIGMLVFLGMVLVCNIVIYKFSNIWFWFTHAGIWFGIILFMISWAGGSIFGDHFDSSFLNTLLTGPAIGSLVLTCGMSLMPLAFQHQYYAIFSPSNSRLVKERLRLGARKLVVVKKDGDKHKAQYPHPSDGPGAPHGGGSSSHPSKGRQSLAYSTIKGAPTPKAVRSRGGYGFSEHSNVDRIGRYSVAASQSGRLASQRTNRASKRNSHLTVHFASSLALHDPHEC